MSISQTEEMVEQLALLGLELSATQMASIDQILTPIFIQLTFKMVM